MVIPGAERTRPLFEQLGRDIGAGLPLREAARRERELDALLKADLEAEMRRAEPQLLADLRRLCKETIAAKFKATKARKKAERGNNQNG
jgi:hypothetical protein